MIKLMMSLEKETKGTFVYKSDMKDTAISTLYIRKEAFAAIKAPESIEVTVENR